MQGTITLEDTTLIFHEVITNSTTPTNLIEYTVIDTLAGKSETKTVDLGHFFKALAIAVHPDGEPDFQKDYPDALLAMPDEPSLRWIP